MQKLVNWYFVKSNMAATTLNSHIALRICAREEHEFIRLHISKYTMVVIVVNEQCNTGDPLETSGGLYRGPPSTC